VNGRRAIAVAFIAIGLGLVAALLLSPNTQTVRLPISTGGPEVTDPPTPTPEPVDDVVPPPGRPRKDATPAPTLDPVGDHDCGPECYEEHKPPRASKRPPS
jgi:hypothetical protein